MALKIDEKLLKRSEPVMQGYIDRGQIAGINTLVASSNGTVYKKSFGYADIESKKLMDNKTIFWLYSMTKPITSVAALILLEQGLYTLSDPISAYIPSFKNPRVLTSIKDVNDYATEPAKREIAIHDLFTHTGGISYGFTEEGVDILYRHHLWNEMARLDGKSAAAIVGSLPLAYHPGEQWLYSASIDILGLLVEALSGQTLGEFMQEHIFMPLGMSETGFSVPAEMADRIATVYEPIDRENKLRSENLKQVDDESPVIGPPPPFQSGGGGLYSTTEDYSLFARMLINGGELSGNRIIGRKTIDLMASDHLTGMQKKHYIWDTQIGYSYGLGVRVMVNPARGGSNGSVGEFGWDGAAGTWVWIDRKEGFIALMMPQLMPNAFYPVAKQFITGVYAALE